MDDHIIVSIMMGVKIELTLALYSQLFSLNKLDIP